MPSTRWITPISKWHHCRWSRMIFPHTKRATSWTAESSRTARQPCRRRPRAVQSALGRTRTGRRQASTAAMDMAGTALPTGGFVAQTITDGRLGSVASAVRHPAAALYPKEAAERTTTATAIGHRRGADPAVAQEDRGPRQTRIRISPATGHAMTPCVVETTMTAGQSARGTTARAGVGLRGWSGATIASVSATFTDDRIDSAMRGFIVGVGVDVACTTDRIRLGVHDARDTGFRNHTWFARRWLSFGGPDQRLQKKRGKRM